MVPFLTIIVVGKGVRKQGADARGKGRGPDAGGFFQEGRVAGEAGADDGGAGFDAGPHDHVDDGA